MAEHTPSLSWLPWLTPLYRQILAQHQQGRGHHALLIQAAEGMGGEVLVWAISRWLLCQKPDGIKSCNQCHGCRLMQAGSHPDWYQLAAEPGKTSLGIAAVREMTEQLYQYGQQGGARVIWLPEATQLTEAAANALLKTLEEPPANSWFFLGSQQPAALLPTLRSRCQRWQLTPPETAISQSWLSQQSNNYLPQAIRAALHLCGGAPLAAKRLLETPAWQDRQLLCDTLQTALHQQDMLQLLPLLNHDDVLMRIDWLLAWLTDAMKWQVGVTTGDQPTLIQLLAETLTAKTLSNSAHHWLQCRYHLHQMPGLNQELILITQLLDWEMVLKSVETYV